MTDWPQIVAEHGPMVYRTAYRLLSHDADAADCFQRTFVSAWELSRTEAIRNWPGLLKRLAVARTLERLRQRRRESSRVTRLPENVAADRNLVVPTRAAEASELAQDLRDALAELEERQAQVFCLACLEDLSYEEIAVELGITVNHVGVLLTRAKASLRERLQAHAPTTPTAAVRHLEREAPP